MMKKIMVVLMVLLCFGLGGLFYWLNSKDDRIAPVITVPEETILYEEGQDTKVLLEGVKAVDDIDGDVSDTLIVESIIQLQDEVSAQVVYFAKDKKNNVAKATRKVDYMPAEGILWMVETETETEESETESEAGKEMVAIDVCNVRVAPNTDCEVVTSLKVGDRVTKIDETEDGWIQVEMNGKTLYIKNDYLKPAEESETEKSED